jgi:hypothetical protein
MLELAIPTDEWDILYRLRLQIERDLLLGAEPGTEFPGDDGRNKAQARNQDRTSPMIPTPRAGVANP